MRISLLITSFGKTGIEISMIRLANGMLRAGHEVDLVVMIDKGTGFRTLLDTGVRIVDLESPRLWTSFPRLVHYMRRERPTAMIAGAPLANGLAGLAKRLIGGPTCVLLTEHDPRLFGFADGRSLKRRILKFCLERGYSGADGLIGVSEGVAAELRKLPYITRDRVHVIYNPVWSIEFARVADEHIDHPWLHHRSDIPVIVSVGRLEEDKCFDVLLKAVAIARREFPVRLLILGEGKERENLSHLIELLNLCDAVQLMGFVHNPLSYMARSSAYVHSSLRDALPTVIIEALACGIPVVSTDSPTGPREILEGGRYGVLVPVGDADALANAIIATLSKNVDAQLLVERAKYFSVDNAVERYERLIEALIASRV